MFLQPTQLPASQHKAGVCVCVCVCVKAGVLSFPPPTAAGTCSVSYLLINRWEEMEKEMATHSSILAWKSPWTEEPGGLKSMGLDD